MHFETYYDKSAQFTTLMTNAFIALSFVAIIKFVPGLQQHMIYFMGACFLLILGIPYSFATRSIEIVEDYIIINRIPLKKKIKRSEIISVSYPFEDKLSILKGRAANNGFYGWSGQYWLKSGIYNVYSNQKENLVLVETENRKYLFGVDQPEVFLNELRKTI